MRRLVSIILVVLTLGLFFNNSVNWHYHQLPNGILVEHAHPFQRSSDASAGSPFENHSHTELEFLLLELLYYSVLVIVMVYLGLMIFMTATPTARVLVPAFTGKDHSLLPFLRGPPAV